MFGNQQDTCLLQHSLQYAVKDMKSDEESNLEREFDLEDEDGAVTTISTTMNSLSRSALRESTFIEKLNRQLLLQRRCHAAIFFTVLRSNGINCAEASKYYESIAHSFPTMSWKFYMKLNFHCKWSEYFVECAKELEPDILSAVLKKILYIEWNEDDQLKYYSWHTVLQAIIWKFFLIEDTSLHSPQDCYSFTFPFVSSQVKTKISVPIFEKDNDSSAKSQMLHSFITLLNHLHTALTSCLGNFDFVKIILHAYKTIFRLLSKVKSCEKGAVKEIFRLNKLLGSTCSEKQFLDVIEAVLQRKDEQIPLAHHFAVTSWEISANYLTFLLCNYWHDVLDSMSKESPFFSLEECLPPISEKELLGNLSPFFKTKFEKEDSNYVQSLKIILSLHYPCATRAAIILLRHPEVRETDEVLTILEKEVPKLDVLQTYPVLVDAVAAAHSKDAKLRLINLFFKILSASSEKIYNDALEYILSQHGINDHFRLDDFDHQLNCFTRKMMTDEEAEKCLLPLFVQSPSDVLKVLIEQALLQGSNEMTVIKILKHIPIACLHSDSLINELKPYFTKDEIVVKEMNNLVNLVQSLMEIHAETTIVDFNMFLQEIIKPNLAAEKKISFTLECLNASLNVLVPNVLQIKTEVLSLLIQCLSSIIDKSIKIGDGRVKELAVTTLSLLNKCQGMTDELKAELWKDLSSYSTSVLVYISKLFGKASYCDLKDSGSKLHESLWLWCCNFKDDDLFQENLLEKKISYDKLVRVLNSVLPHLTKEEWLESARLVGEYARSSKPEALYSVLWLLPKSDPELYAVIRCLMDSFECTLKKGVYDLNYMSNCLSNTIQNIFNQEVNVHLYLNVFLDTCHLTLDNTEEVYTSLLPFLLTLKKSIEDECKEKQLKAICLKLIHNGIKRLPNSEEKLPFFISSAVKN